MAYQQAVEVDFYSAFSEFIETYPDSPYVVGAEIEMKILAQQETGGAINTRPEKVQLSQLLGLPGKGERAPFGEGDNVGLGIRGDGLGGGGTGDMIGLAAAQATANMEA